MLRFAVALLALAGSIASAQPSDVPEPPPVSDPPPAPESTPESVPGPESESEPEPAVEAPASAIDLETLIPKDSTPPKPGDDIAITFNSGQRTEGVLVSSEPGLYIARIGGLDIRLRPSDLREIVRLPSVEERFEQLRGVAPIEDVRALLALSAWAESRGLLTRALGVVEEALDLEPQNGDALRAKATLERQIELKRLQRITAAKSTGAAEEDPQEPSTPVRELVIQRFPMLTPEQINLMKVMEVDLKDPPRMLIPLETIEALIRTHGDHPSMPVTRAERDAFRHAPASEILDMIFRVGARELYPQVRVIGHPASMRAFRDRVNAAWLTNAMATTRCHGGTAGGRLQLQNRKPSSPESFYTNLLILDRFRTREGLELINYARPERSVLLEMGLPRADAIYPHPEVPGWRPLFRSRDDRAYQRTVEWIQMMYQPRPVYPVEYTPPGEAVDAPEEVEAPAPVER